jgi:5-methylcytosine-specific restriction endonuclease McrA
MTHNRPPRPAYVNRLYGRRWRKISQAQIMRNPLCVRCGRGAEVTDHIKPHKGDESLFYDPQNMQSLCKRCHDAKTITEDGGAGLYPTRRDGRPVSEYNDKGSMRLTIGGIVVTSHDTG